MAEEENAGLEKLLKLDRSGYTVLDAVGPRPRDDDDDPTVETSPGTHSRPRGFVCIDGHIYWCKSNSRGGSVQQGLAAELIAGRIAGLLGVGGPVAIVRVTPEAIVGKAGYEHLEGIVFGCREHEGMVHVNKLATMLGGKELGDSQLDLRSWARVVAFQSWVGLGDGAQMMINLATGNSDELHLDHVRRGSLLAAIGWSPSAINDPINLQLLCSMHHADKTTHEAQLLAADAAMSADDQ